jgi:hypothetical protein
MADLGLALSLLDALLLNGKPGLGVFASMKVVEVRVRKLAGFGDNMFGTDLVTKAFLPAPNRGRGPGAVGM